MSINGMFGALNFMEKMGVMANFVKNGMMMFQGMFGHHQQPYMQGPSLFCNQPMMDGGMYPMGSMDPMMGGGMYPMGSMDPMMGGMPMMDGGMPPPPMHGVHGHHHHHHHHGFRGFG